MNFSQDEDMKAEMSFILAKAVLINRDKALKITVIK